MIFFKSSLTTRRSTSVLYFVARISRASVHLVASYDTHDIFFFFIWSSFLASRASAHCCLDLICFTDYLLFVDDHSLICSISNFIYVCFFYLGLLAVCAVHKRFRSCHEEADPLLPSYVVSFRLSNTSFANLLNFSRLCWFSINFIFRSVYSVILVHL